MSFAGSSDARWRGRQVDWPLGVAVHEYTPLESERPGIGKEQVLGMSPRRSRPSLASQKEPHSIVTGFGGPDFRPRKTLFPGNETLRRRLRFLWNWFSLLMVPNGL